MNYPAWQLKKADPAAETSLAGAGCGVLLRRGKKKFYNRKN